MQPDSFQYHVDGPKLKKGQIVHFVKNLADPTLYTAFKLRRNAKGLHTRFLEKDVKAVVYKITSEKTNINGLPQYVQCYTLRFTFPFPAKFTNHGVPDTYFTPKQEGETLPDASLWRDAPYILGFDAVDKMELIHTRNTRSLDYGPCEWGAVGELNEWQEDIYDLESKDAHWSVYTHDAFTDRSEYTLGPYLLEIEPETETRYAKVKAWPHHVDHSLFSRHIGDTIRWGRDPRAVPPNL